MLSTTAATMSPTTRARPPVSPRELPEYLRPVPGPDETPQEPSQENGADPLAAPPPDQPPAASPPAQAPSPQQPAVPSRPPATPRGGVGSGGLVEPQQRGHSGRFLTDVIVDLGFATREQVDAAVDQSRTAGRPPEQILMEQGVLDP